MHNFGVLTGEGPFSILYVSVHPVLEYDQIKIFESLGHRVFSIGFYSDRNSDNGVRPKLPNSEWHRSMGASFHSFGCRGDNIGPSRWKLTREFIAQFDLIIVDHDIEFIMDSVDDLDNVPVIWRTIGQDSLRTEKMADHLLKMGMKIVRWSPVQEQLDGYAGGDVFIRASVDPDTWHGWTGEDQRIVTFNNDFAQRPESLSLPFWQEAVSGLPVDLYGLRNEIMPEWRGVASFDRQRDILRHARAAFITGTSPAPYTLGFIEAWMTGIPLIHVGRKNAPAGTFEVDHLIQHGVNGFVVNSPREAHDIMAQLLADIDLAQRISAAGRLAAIEVFALPKIQAQWKDFLLTMQN